jgi:succinate dehydrogenase/fumarate reductase cytochrome b subunit
MTLSSPAWPALQQRSGLLLSLFLGLHLVNQAAAACGPAVYDPLQAGLRRLYQQPLVEVVAVLGALAVHIVSSIIVARRRSWSSSSSSSSPSSSSPSSLPTWLRWHRRAGRFLAVVIVGHVVATRAPSLLWGEPPGFHGVAFTMQAAPPIFIPYYLLLGVAGVVHGGFGVAIALPGLIGRAHGLVRRRALRVALGIAGVAVVLGVLGFAGVVVDVDAAAVREGAFARRFSVFGRLPD